MLAHRAYLDIEDGAASPALNYRCSIRVEFMIRGIGEAFVIEALIDILSDGLIDRQRSIASREYVKPQGIAGFSFILKPDPDHFALLADPNNHAQVDFRFSASCATESGLKRGDGSLVSRVTSTRFNGLAT